MAMLSLLGKHLLESCSKSNPTIILNRIIIQRKSLDLSSQNIMDSTSKETSSMTLGAGETITLDR